MFVSGAKVRTMAATPQTTKRAVAYIRVSAVMGRDELISPELQRHEIDLYAKRNGLQIVDEVRDIDRSGRTFTKRRVGEVIEAIRSGEYSTVVLWKWSRWGRNLRESLIHLATVEAAGGSVRAATEDFDPNTSIGRFTRDQMLLIAQLQSDQIGDGWRETHAKRRRDGLPHTSQKRYGYRYVKGQGYVPEPEEAAILRSAYERIVSGEAIRGLALDLNVRGIKTVTGGYWTATALRKVLDTGFAAGLIRWRSRTTGGAGLRDFDNWEPGAHEPIIETELWDAYLAKRLATAETPARLRVAAHALSGLVWCGACEDLGIRRRMVTTYTSRGVHRWVCARAKMARAHEAFSVTNADATDAVWAWVERECEHRENEAVTDAAERLARRERSAGDIERYEAQVVQLTRRRKNLTRQLADLDEGVDGDDVRELLAETNAELAGAKNALALAQLAVADEDDGAIRAFRGLRDEWENFEPHEHRLALSAVMEGLVVRPGPAFVVRPRWAPAEA